VRPQTLFSDTSCLAIRPAHRRPPPKADNTSVKAVTLQCPGDNYKWTHADGSWDGIVAVRVQSTAGFTLTEFGVNSGRCTQWVTVDMGEVKQVGMVR
jgi:hypothetical protein